jgi:signal transduction histidine kinase
VLQHFLWAAGPAVAFLSLATLATGWVFNRHGEKVGGAGAGLLAGAFVLWGIHHLDYVFLRARGAWNPWGYYLDICFELAVGAGVLLLVLDDLRRGLGALVSLSGDLQHAGRNEDVLSTLLERPLTLPAVRGSALFLRSEGTVRLVRGAGAAATWAGVPTPELGAALERAFASSRPQVAMARDGGLPGHAFEAVLPVFRGTEVTGALVITGDARDPFAALDENYLVTLGQQVGAALENADLTRRLHTRTAELARLSARMVEQHEDERRRLSRELHDETAQVFSAVKMELGVLRDRVAPADSTRLDHVLSLVDTGIRGIRSVVHSLRPSLLDDLGLIPALRSLTTDFGGRSTFAVRLDAPPSAAAQRRRAGALPRAGGGAGRRGAPRRRGDGGQGGGVGRGRRARTQGGGQRPRPPARRHTGHRRAAGPHGHHRDAGTDRHAGRVGVARERAGRGGTPAGACPAGRHALALNGVLRL